MKDYPGAEAALELSEAALDQLSKNDFLTDIPVVGIAFKVCKVVAGIRDRLYIAKLNTFLSRLDAISREEQHEMLTNLLPEPKQREKVGERLLMILEQLSDHDKPAIMAVFFIAYLRRMIDLSTLLRIWDSIATAYCGDLSILLGLASEPAFGGGNSHLQYLTRTGLSQVRGIAIDNDGTMQYEASPFGYYFIKIYHEANAA